MIKIVATINKRVFSLLGIDGLGDNRVYIGDSNVEHMEKAHPHDYAKYGKYIADIINSPDYVGKHKANGSIEFVKEFQVGDEYVKVAVRASGGKRYFARSIYVLNKRRVDNFIKNNTLKKY